MNKAEEQYLYRMGRTKAQNDIMFFALTWKEKEDLIIRVKNVIERNEIDNVKILKSKIDEGISDYNSEILRLIYSNVITDWPSFIEYMTGETYEICQCHKCSKVRGELPGTRMILCPKCGNKRCPHATNHELECTNSNEPGQEGSVYE